MEITLTAEERELLCHLLEEEIENLRSEEYHAESHPMKETIHARETLAKGLRERLTNSRKET